MTLSNAAERLIKLGEALPELIDESFKVGLVNFHANMKNRIFTLNKDINGNPLGSYSDKTTLIGASSFRNKTQANAFFSKEKKAQKARKKEADTFENVDDDSGWRTVEGNALLLLPGGYKELRRMQGMKSDTVNLQYTGELNKSGTKIKTGKNLYQVVFTNELSKDKARGFEKKHGGAQGRVFGASDKEADQIVEDINNHFAKRLKEYV